MQRNDWPPLEVPEWRTKKNTPTCKRKSIFVAQSASCATVEAAIEIAKEQAQQMGMGNKALLVAGDAPYSAVEGGWQVIVKSRI